MSQRHYYLTLIILILALLVNSFFAFEIPGIRSLIIDYTLVSYGSLVFAYLLFWTALLLYFKKRNWYFAFISGLFLGLISTLMISLNGLFLMNVDSSIIVFFELILWLNTLCSVVFLIGLLITEKTAGLKLIRTYAILGVINEVLKMGYIFDVIPNFQNTLGFAWLIQGAFLILHFIYERNKNPTSLDSKEMLEVL